MFYTTLYLQAMNCSQCSQLTEHESLVPPRARNGPVWQIRAKLRNIYLQFTAEEICGFL